MVITPFPARTKIYRALCLATLCGTNAVSAAPALEEVIVTAQKREQSILDVPKSVAVLSGNTLEEANITSTRDLSRIVPSLTFRQGFIEAASSFSIRGVTTSTFTGSLQPSVVTVVDDIPMARAGQSIIDLSDMERVEVLRGPQGTFFGINATAGALNVVTQQPEEEFRGYLEATYDENDVDGGWIYKGMVTGSLSDTVRGRLNATYKEYGEHTENLTKGSPYPGMGDEKKWGVVGNLDADIADNFFMELKLDYYESELSNIGGPILAVREYYPGFEVDGQVFGAENFPGVSELDAQRAEASPDQDFVQNATDNGWGTVESGGIGVKFTWDINDSLVAHSITSYREFDTEAGIELTQRPLGVVVDPSTDTSLRTPLTGARAYQRGTQPRAQDMFTQEFRIEGSAENLDYIAGLFYSNFQDEWTPYTPVRLDPFNGQFSIYGLLQDAYVTDVEFDTYAAFFDVNYSLTDRLSLVAGIRYTYEEVDYSHTLWNQANAFSFGAPGNGAFIGSGDASADWLELKSVVNELTSDVSIATHHTASDRSDDDVTGRLGLLYSLTDNVNIYATLATGFKGAGLNTTPTGFDPESIEVDPETVESFEMGLKGNFFDKRLSLNSAVFVQETDNSQQGTLIAGTPASQLENVGGISSHGLELEVSYALTDYVTLSGALSWVDAEIEDFIHQCYSGQVFETGCDVRVFDDGGNLVGMSQDVSGKQAPHTPEWAYSLTANMNIPLSELPFGLYGQMTYSWQDELILEYTHDPLQIQDDYGLLDISLGIRDDEERYDVSLYVKNATDERWSQSGSAINSLLWRVNSIVGRDGAGTFYGIKARWSF